MHITAEQTLRCLVSLFIYVWCGILVAIVVIAIVTSRRERWKERRKWLVSLIIAPLCLYILAVIGSWFWLQSAANRFFDGLANQKLTRLVIQAGGVSKEINDEEAIRNLLNILRQAPRVAAHHSHTSHEYQLDFPEINYAFTLGPDSEVENEYWLFWDDYPGFQAKVSHIAPLRQLRSPRLTDWLNKHVTLSVAPF